MAKIFLSAYNHLAPSGGLACTLVTHQELRKKKKYMLRSYSTTNVQYRKTNRAYCV